VRLVRFGAERGRENDRVGSEAFRIAPLAAVTGARVVCVHLGPGGRIGRHPAVGPQLLAVVSGDATVSGADGVAETVGAGVAAVWEAGEEHETRTAAGLTAIVVEGERLDVLAGL
jgi:quercetin dioxygenase-like cupin family protein